MYDSTGGVQEEPSLHRKGVPLSPSHPGFVRASFDTVTKRFDHSNHGDITLEHKHAFTRNDPKFQKLASSDGAPAVLSASLHDIEMSTPAAAVTAGDNFTHPEVEVLEEIPEKKMHSRFHRFPKVGDGITSHADLNTDFGKMAKKYVGHMGASRFIRQAPVDVSIGVQDAAVDLDLAKANTDRDIPIPRPPKPVPGSGLQLRLEPAPRRLPPLGLESSSSSISVLSATQRNLSRKVIPLDEVISNSSVDPFAAHEIQLLLKLNREFKKQSSQCSVSFVESSPIKRRWRKVYIYGQTFPHSYLNLKASIAFNGT